VVLAGGGGYHGRGFQTCTECKDGCQMHVKNTHTDKGMMGFCEPIDQSVQVVCLDVDSNVNLEAKPTSANTLCTKFGTTTNRMFGGKDTNSQVAAHFASVKGTHDWSVAKCSIWKQTSCRGLSCSTKKYVRCMDVCKLTHYGNSAAGDAPGTSDCNPSLCSGDFGKVACREIARMA